MLGGLVNVGCNKITAAILAGGGSTRMGTNKALLKLGNKTIIERVVNPLQDIFDNVLVVTNESEDYHMLKGVKFVPDCISTGEKSSLIGLYSGLKQSETFYIFAIGCDMPFVNTGLVKYMADLLENEDILVPFVGGHYQPLYAIYGKSCIPEFEKLLQRGRHKITGIFKNMKVNKILEEDIKILIHLCFVLKI